MNAPTPELAKQLRAIEAGNRHDREWMADRLEEIVFLCDIVSSHSISAREAARPGDPPAPRPRGHDVGDKDFQSPSP
jgi:hypothetical protein